MGHAPGAIRMVGVRAEVIGMSWPYSLEQGQPIDPALLLTGEFRTTILREARRRAPLGVDPEDILMDTIVAVLREPHVLCLRTGQIHRFLITTVSNLCSNSVRGQARDGRRATQLMTQLAGSSFEKESEVDLDGLLAAIGPRLSPAERQLLKWIAEGQTITEVGSHLGLSDGTVRVRLHRARLHCDQPDCGQ
jgi:RNA polymerase sigma factor (sigma-70 family)